ncbi:MAG: MoxR family ATPase [Clostridiales bacterium]|jgi:MoxR-like ATPase|nr:MoxR family ATPase [Clostridiales bacterium]
MEIKTGYTKEIADKIRGEMNKVVINQPLITDYGLTAVLSGGHVLIEGLPGLAKTLWARCLAKTISVEFKRVQFTSDLMPADILGTKVYDMSKAEFSLKKGPLFTNLFLADEINRTPPKTQSALLEVMEEKSITIDGETHVLSLPFIVFATQNPVEFEGTYPLPEALVDRFSMKLLIDYPGLAAEKKVLSMFDAGFSPNDISEVECVTNAEEFLACREEIKNVRVDESIVNYILSIVETTRRVSSVAIGASPRGSIALLMNTKTYAAISGRDFVTPDDVRDLALPILRHRIILKPEAEIDGVIADKVIENILSQVKVPR